MIGIAFLFACSGDKHQQELDDQCQLGYENGQNEGYEEGCFIGTGFVNKVMEEQNLTTI